MKTTIDNAQVRVVKLNKIPPFVQNQFGKGQSLKSVRKVGDTGKPEVRYVYGDGLFKATQLFILPSGGVYTNEEVVAVTDEQLRLESWVLAILSVFPNQNPETLLGSKASYEDRIIIKAGVKTLRKLMAKHPGVKYQKKFRAAKAARERQYKLATEYLKASIKVVRLQQQLEPVHQQIINERKYIQSV